MTASTMELISENGQPTITLTRAECSSLELKLNVSSKGKLWRHIGDYLFEYGTGKSDAVTSILLTAYQREFIGILLKKSSWETCRDL